MFLNPQSILLMGSTDDIRMFKFASVVVWFHLCLLGKNLPARLTLCMASTCKFVIKFSFGFEKDLGSDCLSPWLCFLDIYRVT